MIIVDFAFAGPTRITGRVWGGWARIYFHLATKKQESEKMEKVRFKRDSGSR